MNLRNEGLVRIVRTNLPYGCKKSAYWSHDTRDPCSAKGSSARKPDTLSIDLVYLIVQLVVRKRDGVCRCRVRLDDTGTRIDELADDLLDQERVLQVVDLDWVLAMSACSQNSFDRTSHHNWTATKSIDKRRIHVER